jgi:serine phosphatase RsbU (regulator of sigma subunit)/CHASE2 domain-containing sensor protein
VRKALLLAFAGAHGRPLGAAVLVALLVASFQPSLPLLANLRLLLFDTYQSLAPRARSSAAAVIVAVDEKSLRELGQWPWPRTLVAELVDAVARTGSAAIGIDILIAEPDRMSPESIARLIEHLDPRLSARLSRLPSNDSVLADALRRHPVALGVAGIERLADGAQANGRSAPFRVIGADPSPFIRHFAGTLRSLEQLDAAAPGHGLLSADPSGDVIRRVPLVASIAGVLMPALSMEVLRVAGGAASFSIQTDATGVKQVGFKGLSVRTAADGAVWVHFSPHDEDRFVPAVDVIRGRVDPKLLEGKIALIGVTGLGLLDFKTTPLGELVPGIEIHAQIIEGIFENSLLRRPELIEHVERGLIFAGGLLVILAVPAVRPRNAAVIYLLLIAVMLAMGFGLYRLKHLLVDIAQPALAVTLLFGVMLTGTLIEADRQRRALQRALESEREAAARAAGELEAARRIQMGMLPPPSANFYGDARFSLQALIEPAKSVGGDLYDFFKLDGDRLFFMVGDVAGKGLPASIFMAVSKALYKSAALRSRVDAGADIGEVMRAANEEIARDNPEMLFVTVFAAILDLRSGELTFCNAGHDAPFSLRPGSERPIQLESDGGPPLCVIEHFRYQSERYRLLPGEALCLFTDGVTEAMNAGADLYGRRRLFEVLEASGSAGDAMRLVNAIRDDVRAFVGATERSDDITILVLKWNGGTP